MRMRIISDLVAEMPDLVAETGVMTDLMILKDRFFNRFPSNLYP